METPSSGNWRVYGLVADDVSKLTVRLSGGAVEDVEIENSAFVWAGSSTAEALVVTRNGATDEMPIEQYRSGAPAT